MSIWANIGQHFAKILLFLFVFCGLIWVIDKLFLAKRHRALGIQKRPIWLEFGG